MSLCRLTVFPLSDVRTSTAVCHTQTSGFVGFELAITRLVGKWKLGQNRPDADREGLARGFAAERTADGAALSTLTRGTWRDEPST